MLKAEVFYRFVVASLLVAGAFGALHDQISYTVSSEYFTRFKFFQFSLQYPWIPERLRASIVGILASWWMGVPLGVLIGFGGYIQPTPAQMQRALALSLRLTVILTAVAALVGLAYGYITTAASLNPDDYRNWYIPQGLQQPRRYLCAGHMHNAAYVGGLLSIPAAWIFHIAYRHYHKNCSPKLK